MYSVEFLFRITQINKLRVPLIIYCILFLIGQIIGYVLNIDLLKIYLSIDNGNGSSYSLTCIALPIILTLVINFIYSIFNRRIKNK